MVYSVTTKNIYSLFILFILVVVTVDARHGSSEFSVARRSLHGKREEKKVFTAIPASDSGVNNVGGDPSPSPDTTSVLPPVTITLPNKSASSTESQSSKPTEGPSSSSKVASESSASEAPPASKPTPSDAPSSSASSGEICVAGKDGLCIPAVPSSSSRVGSTPTEPSSDPASGSDSNSVPPTSGPAGSASASLPSITPPPASSSSDGGIGIGLPLSSLFSDLSSVLSGLPSDLSGIISTVTSDLSALPSQVTSDLSAIVSGASSVISALPSDVSSIVSSLPSDISSVVSSLPSDVSSIVSSLPSDISSVVSSLPSDVSSVLSSGVGDVTSGLSSILSSASVSLPVSITDGPSGSASASGPAITDPPVSGNSTVVGPSGSDDGSGSVSASITDGPSGSISASASGPSGSASASDSVIISLPDGNSTTSTPVFDNGGTSVSISIPSDLGFVTTAVSLAFDSVSSTDAATTLTDPDQATTTIPTSVLSATAALETAPLPSGLPNIIYPADTLDITNPQVQQSLQGYTIISILFNQELDWPFVVQSDLATPQIMAWMPQIIATAVSIPVSQVKTWALQVQIPSAYKSPADAALLGTLYRAYIPTESVDTLSNEIKARQSAFYTGVSQTVAQQLAQRVVSGYSITGGPDPLSAAGGSVGGGSASDTSGASSQSKSRQDAIIGVVSTVGAIALLVLGFLVFRSIQRRRELRHHRLSDPPDVTPAFMAGVRQPGRDFDQDSIGGQRRRSFYFAEDSLRDATQQMEAYDTAWMNGGSQQYQAVPRSSPTPGQMTQRRVNVNPNNIGPPVLQESSMNW